ncbi:MAG: hypothetical protein ACRDSP_07140 [Pseudonocardiaceae bacterium]
MTDRAQRATARSRPVQRLHQSADPAAEKRCAAEQPSVRLAGSVRTKPVRRSVDLSPTCHARLSQWCTDAAAEIGANRVTGQDVIRALVARLLADQRLAQRIRADLSINI